jgi:hypothetical protein
MMNNTMPRSTVSREDTVATHQADHHAWCQSSAALPKSEGTAGSNHERPGSNDEQHIASITVCREDPYQQQSSSISNPRHSHRNGRTGSNETS